MALPEIADKIITFGLSFAGAQINAQVTIFASVGRELVEATLSGTFDFVSMLVSFLGVWLAIA